MAAEIPTHGTGSKIIAVSPYPDSLGRTVAYVSNWFSRNISIIDVSTDKLEAASRSHQFGQVNENLFIKTLHIPSNSSRQGNGRFGIASRGIAFTHDGTLGIVTNFDSQSVFIVDAKTHEPLVELPPVPRKYDGPSSMRHVVITDDDQLAYISMMGQNSILKVDLSRLKQIVRENYHGEYVHLSQWVWDEILLDWGNSQKYLPTNFLSPEHTRPASARNGETAQAHPNTIVLDPRSGQRYLYVSNRTTDLSEGKVDVIDTYTGKIIFTLGSGHHPTALAISPDGQIVVSSEFSSSKPLLRFYNVGYLTEVYEELLQSGQLQ